MEIEPQDQGCLGTLLSLLFGMALLITMMIVLI